MMNIFKKINILTLLSSITQNSCTYTTSSLHISSSVSLHPWFITGFSDAEACFYVRITKKNNMKIGWTVEPGFFIRLHIKDLAVLNLIQAFFNGVGKIYSYKSVEEAIFRVSSMKELEIIVDHFDKYPLISQKWSDFMLFKQVMDLMKCKKHLTLEGLLDIVNIKASMNTETILAEFPDLVPAIRPSVPDLKDPIDPNWMAGFVSGEGCFSLSIKKSVSSKLGETAWLRFIVTQHKRDQGLINSFVNFFGDRGKINQDSRTVYYVVQRLSDLTENIIPFFDKYSLQGVKVKDFEDFKKVSKLMKSRAHLTKEGLEEIRKIKSGMNTLRQ